MVAILDNIAETSSFTEYLSYGLFNKLLHKLDLITPIFRWGHGGSEKLSLTLDNAVWN